MSESPRNIELRRRLHEGDPLAGDPGLDRAERQAMRRAILEQVTEDSPVWRRQFPLALGVAALLAMALGAAWWPSATEEPTASATPRGEASTSLGRPSSSTRTPGETDSQENRTILFETPGGTLVVWVLTPDFDS